MDVLDCLRLQARRLRYEREKVNMANSMYYKALIALLLIVYFFGRVYILGPIKLRSNNRIKASPTPKFINLSELPQFVVSHFGEAYHKLVPAGFTLVAYLDISETIRGIFHYVMLLENKSTLDNCWVSVLAIQAGNELKPRTTKTEFFVRINDGATIIVNNTPKLGLFGPVPGKTVMRVPELRDVSKLYEAFLKIVQLNAKSPKISLVGKNPITLVQESMMKELTDQVATGYLELTEKRDAYMPTWKGACLMAWKSLWPVKPIRNMFWKSGNRKTLRELNIGVW